MSDNILFIYAIIHPVYRVDLMLGTLEPRLGEADTVSALDLFSVQLIYLYAIAQINFS